ncbi:hypothetical protein D3C85_1906110 [compost metagenome]
MYCGRISMNVGWKRNVAIAARRSGSSNDVMPSQLYQMYGACGMTMRKNSTAMTRPIA